MNFWGLEGQGSSVKVSRWAVLGRGSSQGLLGPGTVLWPLRLACAPPQYFGPLFLKQWFGPFSSVDALHICLSVFKLIGHFYAQSLERFSVHEEALRRKSLTKFRNVNCAFISMHCEISFCRIPRRSLDLFFGPLEEGSEHQFLARKCAERTFNEFGSCLSLAILQVCFNPFGQAGKGFWVHSGIYAEGGTSFVTKAVACGVRVGWLL